MLPRHGGRRLPPLPPAAGLVLRGAFSRPRSSRCSLRAGNPRKLRGRGRYVAGRTQEVSGEAGLRSYPTAWLKGIFEARRLFADGVWPPVKQLSLAVLFVRLRFWRGPAALSRAAGPDPRRARRLGFVTVFLSPFAQRVNVYYASRCARSRSWRPRGSRRAGPTTIARRRASLRAPGSPCAPGSCSRCRIDRGNPRGALERAGRGLGPLRHARLDAHLSAARGRPLRRRACCGRPIRRSSLAREPCSRRGRSGTCFSTMRSNPSSRTTSGTGFLDSIRFFLAGSEEERSPSRASPAPGGCFAPTSSENETTTP